MDVRVEVRDGASAVRVDLGEAEGDELADFIEMLDGLKRSLMVLTSGGGDEILVGGGPEHFLATIESPFGGWNLVNPDGDPADEPVDFTVGGQAITCPAEFTVTAAQVRAGLAAYESGSMEPAWRPVD